MNFFHSILENRLHYLKNCENREEFAVRLRRLLLPDNRDQLFDCDFPLSYFFLIESISSDFLAKSEIACYLDFHKTNEWAYFTTRYLTLYNLLIFQDNISKSIFSFIGKT